MSLAVATCSTLAADAGRAMAEAGGNAVDAAVASALVNITTEPGVCSVDAGGFVTVHRPGETPCTLDGYVAVPGLEGAGAEESDPLEVYLEYGGGVSTRVGCPSVGVGGGIAALGEASRRWGTLPWSRLLQPAIAAARDGFPMPRASYSYLCSSGRSIYGRSDEGFNALHHEDGRLRREGEIVLVPHLAETLESLAERGSEEFYSGALGEEIVDHVRAGGGRMRMRDRAEYRVLDRDALVMDLGEWKVATNPPPAIGGCVLGAMLMLMSGREIQDWTSQTLSRLISVQRAVLGYRRQQIDPVLNTEDAVRKLLDLAKPGDLANFLESPSTVHTSAVDDEGVACAITLSSGYGAGEMPRHTGIWLNNCLGELELNQVNPWRRSPGSRLPSNMAPTVAWIPGTKKVLAIGSPGADRITTALLQVILNHLVLGLPLDDAVAAPRAHVELKGDDYQVACEPGLGLESGDFPVRQFEDISMFFGGVGAAGWDPQSGFHAAADPRRTGAVWHQCD